MKLASSLKLIALSAALAMSSMVVMAAADPQQLTIRDIVTQQTQLRSQVTAGKGAFKDMSKAERKALAERQDRVLQMLGGNQTLDEMPPDQRTGVQRTGMDQGRRHQGRGRAFDLRITRTVGQPDDIGLHDRQGAARISRRLAEGLAHPVQVRRVQR